jgi:hypothetical protein
VTTTSASQLSVAEAMPVLPGAVLSSHSIVVFAGHNMIVGGVLSSTVITWLQVLVLPQSSVANHVRVIVYSWIQVWEAAVTSLNVTAGIPSQLSVADASPVLPGRVLSSHSIVVFAGQKMIVGGVLSSTKIV